MAIKPTYEELEQRVRELELETEKHKEFERVLHQQAQILSSIKDTIVIITPEMKTIYANQPAKELFGDRPEMFTDPCYRFFKKRDTACESCPVLKTIEDEKPHRLVTKSYDKDGKEMWRLNTAFPFYDWDGRVIAAIEVITNYTPEKKAAMALKESEERHRALFDNMSDAVAIYKAKNEGEDFTFVDFNKPGERIESIHKEAVIGKGVLEVFPGVRDFGLFDVFQRVWKTGKSEHHPISMYKDERIAGWRDNFVFRLPSGEIVAIYSDETERMQKEEALRESEEKYRTLADSSLTGVFIHQDSKYVFVNDRFAEMHGYEPEELLGRNHIDLIHPDQREIIRERADKGLKGEEVPQCYEIKRLKKDGEVVWHEIMVSDPITYRGSPAIMGHEIDITERKRAEEALRESEERFVLFMDHFPDVVFMKDLKGRLVYANKAYKRRGGHKKKEDWYGKTNDQLWPPETAASFNKGDQEVLSKGRSMEFIESLPHPDGQIRTQMTTKFRVLKDDEPAYLGGIGLDITDHKLAEEALRESEEKFRLLTEQSLLGIVIIQDGLVKYVNEAASGIAEYSIEEVLDWKPNEFGKLFYPDDLEFVMEQAQKKQEGTEDVVTHYSYRMLTKSGKVKWVDQYSKTITFVGKTADLITIIDITESKLAEDRIKASLEEKEILLREIHHRVKNNMQVVISLLSLQSDKIKDQQYVEMLKESQDRIKSMALIHEKLYQSKDFANIDFDGYVKALVNSLFVSHGANPDKIASKIEIKDISLGLDYAIPCGLIINELVSNSLKYAFPNEREGEIGIGLQKTSENEVELTVSDNGIGIPEELDFGTIESLGLDLVKVLAEHQLGGKIELKRAGGTSFSIRFTVKTDRVRI
jgi:PAS domain S-box-containing protein